MAYSFKIAAALTLFCIFSQPLLAFEALDRNGFPLNADESSPSQFVLPNTLSKLGPRHLSFDAKINQIVYDQLSKGVKQYHAEAAAGLVMDPDTGELLAMVSIDTKKEKKSSNYTFWIFIKNGQNCY